MPDSKQPLAPLSAALPEPRLVGTWSGKDLPEGSYLTIRQRDGNLFDIALFGDRGMTVDYYSAYATDIGGRRFANLKRGYSSRWNFAGPDYYFVNYRFEGTNRLVVRFLAEKAVIGAIKAGRLKGTLTAFEQPEEIINIDDEPARLVEFLNSTDAAMLFDKPLTFTRTPTP